MNPKFKAHTIYILCFAAIFLLTRYAGMQIVSSPNVWTTVIPLILAAVLSPQPYSVMHQLGKRYGLKSFFSPKKYWFN